MEKQAKKKKPLVAAKPKMGWGSDVVAEMLRRLGMPYISINPGSSYRGLHDSLVNYLGNQRPRMLLTLHEEHAVAIAHGYAKVTEQPMAVAVHSNVGLMHASMAIYNAWCDRVPIFILGATGPVDAHLRRPRIDWIHTSRDQGALIRHYTKWDDQPGSVEATLESMLRAHQLARTAPHGPVYICLDVAMQEQKLPTAPPLPDPARFQPAPPQEPPAHTIQAAAEMLCKARNPVMLAGRVTRSQQGWEQRVKLAEALDAWVVTDHKQPAAFPTRHRLQAVPPTAFRDAASCAVLKGADVVLSLDWVDLGGAIKAAWEGEPPTARIIHCSVDSYSHNGWSMDYKQLPPVDLPMLAQPETVVPALLAAIEKIGGRNGSGRRAASWNQGREPKAPRPKKGAFGLRELAHCVKQQVAGEKVTFVRFPLGWPNEVIHLEGPLDYLGADGGAGVGSGPGLAVGAALALRGSGRVAVSILGDGDFLMGVNAFWTAAAEKIPLLVVVANNRSYFNDERHQERVAVQRNRPVENKWVGQRLDNPAPNLAGLASAQGLQAWGPVTKFQALPAILAEAFEAAKAGGCCVVDVHVTPGYVSGE